jgi:hypothetical protein
MAMVLDDDQTTVAEAREGRGRVPDEPDALLTRAQTAEALTACGFPTTKATLATKAVRGGGPKFSKWGNKPLYRWRDAMAWATARLSSPIESTSELHVDRSHVSASAIEPAAPNQQIDIVSPERRRPISAQDEEPNLAETCR